MGPLYLSGVSPGTRTRCSWLSAFGRGDCRSVRSFCGACCYSGRELLPREAAVVSVCKCLCCLPLLVLLTYMIFGDAMSSPVGQGSSIVTSWCEQIIYEREASLLLVVVATRYPPPPRILLRTAADATLLQIIMKSSLPTKDQTNSEHCSQDTLVFICQCSRLFLLEK